MLNIEAHVTSFKMNKLSFKLFGADLFFSLEEKFGPFKTALRGGIKHSSIRKSVPDTKKNYFLPLLYLSKADALLCVLVFVCPAMGWASERKKKKMRRRSLAP